MAKRKRTNMTNSDLQNITHKTDDRVTRSPLKTVGKLVCSGGIRSSCSTSDCMSKCSCHFCLNYMLSRLLLSACYCTFAAYPSGTLEFTQGFSGVRVTRSLDIYFICDQLRHIWTFEDMYQNLTTRNPCVRSFLVSSNPLSRKS